MKISSRTLHRSVQLSLSLAIVTIVAFSLLSFKTRSLLPSVWSQLGISENTGMTNIKKSFLEGYLYSYGASAAKKVAVGDRIAVANDVLLYAKQYVGSEAFRTEYEKARTLNTPARPAGPKSKDQIQAEQLATLRKTLEDTEKSMKTLPEDLKSGLGEVEQMLKDQIKEMEDPDNEMLALFAEGERMSHQNAMQQYELAMSGWRKKFPEDPKAMIRHRLEQFLELTADVDYSAALKEEYGLKKFVNATYERKPDEWKMAYRCGKPVVEFTRSFAKQWLTELH